MTTSRTKAAGAEKEITASSQRGMNTSVIILLAAFFLATFLQQILWFEGLVSQEGTAKALPVFLGLLAFFLTLGAGIKSSWRRFLASNHFAVPVILALALLSIVGTLVIQNQPEAALHETYGPATRIIKGFFLYDLFHSFGFTALLGMGAAGLVLVLIRKRRLTWRYGGALGAHLGLLLLLAGAGVGNLWGVKGRLGLRKGETTNNFTVTSKESQTASLGFELRLDDFRLLHYKANYRIMVFDVTTRPESLILSLDPASQDLKRLDDLGVKVLGYWPDHGQETIVQPQEAHDNMSVAALGLKDPQHGQEMRWIFDEGAPHGGRLADEDLPLTFVWSASRAQSLIQAQPASPHRIVIGGQALAVEVGKTYPLPGTNHTIEILRALSDFVIDSATKEPTNRSDKPNNPALEVAFHDASGQLLGRTWLFAKFPGFQHQGKDDPTASLHYSYQEQPSLSQGALLVGETGEIWRLEGGAVQSKERVEVGRALQVGHRSLTVAALHPSVRREYRDINRSDEPLNPALRVQVKDGPPRLLKAKQPLPLADGTRVLALAPQGEAVRDYLSTLTVLEGGHVVKTQMVEVNHPLEHRGYSFYQNDYRPDDPTFSGFQVVKDPGLWVVYLGLTINTLGILLVVFAPRRRRSSTKDRGEKA